MTDWLWRCHDDEDPMAFSTCMAAYREMKRMGRQPSAELVTWCAVGAYSNFALWWRELVDYPEDWELRRAPRTRR